MTIPDHMRVVELMGHEGPDQLVYHDDWPTSQPRPGEVLIKVDAYGLNNTEADLPEL